MSGPSWYFHVFTDNVDTHTHDIMIALSTFMQYAQDVGRARLVLEVEDNNEEELIYDNLLAVGDLPA